MPYRICKIFEIESGHMLSKHPEKCRFPHGHSRRVEFVLEADSLDQSDMVCDFKVIKEIMGTFLDQLDHAMCMNTTDAKYGDLKSAYGARVIGFENTDPTTEMMAKLIFDHFCKGLAAYSKQSEVRYPVRPNLRVVAVRLSETSSSWAEYSE